MTSSPATVMSILGGATILGYYAGRLAKKVRLPSLIGYMFLGVLLGPSLFDLLSQTTVEHVSFITELALGLVAFSIGSELSLASLRRLGSGIVWIIFAESFAAFFMVLGAVYLLTGNLPLALVFAAVAPASAPAGTVAVIQEYKAKGDLTKALYAVVGFDDGLAIIIFGFAAAVARSLLTGAATGASVSLLTAMTPPLMEVVFSIVIGTVLGLVFCQLIKRLEKGPDLLIMVVGMVLLSTGLSLLEHLSLILTNMVIGFVLVNTRRENTVHRVNAALMNIMPLIFILFFCLAGAHLEVGKLASLGLLGLVYIVARSAGLIGGSRLGAIFGKVEKRVRDNIGLGILSQAGVAIGLSLIIQQEFGALYAENADAFDRLAESDPLMNPLTLGTTVITSITATCIVFEIIGPILTKVALKRAGEIAADA